jgi:hypothetical protein
VRTEKFKWLRIDDDQLQDLWNLGLSDRAIAKKLGCSQTGVTRARQRLNLPSHFGGDPRPPREIYEESRERANAWKRQNPERVKAAFARWQKEHRLWRTFYYFMWKKKYVGKCRRIYHAIRWFVKR